MKSQTSPLTFSGLARYLVKDTLLEKDTALSALQQSEAEGISLVSYLVNNNLVTSASIVQCLKRNLGLDTAELKQYALKPFVIQALSLDFIRRHRIIPLEKKQGLLHIGMADPMDQSTLEMITFHTGFKTLPVIIHEDALDLFIEQYCREANTKKPLALNLLHQISLENTPQNNGKIIEILDEPLIRFVDELMKHAIEQNASDIHIEPYFSHCRIRYRRDGVLYIITTLALDIMLRIVSRLKILAKLDIAERRLPQDGRFLFNDINIRMNVCPTLFGEKVVLRLLNPKNFFLDLQTLGMNEQQYPLFISSISKPQGMILVTGPTGCGKTVTLYSALHYLNSAEKNISTVEDPIEIQLTGINQVNTQPKIGLDFPAVLRTLLRQDPDIIMIGEIRDKETANIAIQAAQTGHLVLSTLHTNSALESIPRLISMGISPYTLLSSIFLIMAQRLVRVLCSHCKQPDTLSPLNNSKNKTSSYGMYRAVGCEQCLNGYAGRTGIYEFLPMDDGIANLILSDVNQIMLKKEIQKKEHPLLQQIGHQKVLAGITSFAEIARVLQT